MFGITCISLTTLFIVAGAPDYLHDSDVVGWIKLHKTPATFKDAYLTCFYEGVHLKEMPISVSYGFRPDENCVILTGNRRAKTSNCTRLLPYMCYRNRREQPVNVECGTFDNKYKLEPLTGSCYKLHEEREEWSRANTICFAEGGYLAVVNNEEEANILKHMSSKRLHKISKHTVWEPMFIGLRDWDQTGMWTTVQGDAIKNVYHVWGWGQPDNLGQGQYCGSLLKTGKLDDTWCNVKAMFMCEKDPAKVRFEYPFAINLTDPDGRIGRYFTTDLEAVASF